LRVLSCCCCFRESISEPETGETETELMRTRRVMNVNVEWTSRMVAGFLKRRSDDGRAKKD